MPLYTASVLLLSVLAHTALTEVAFFCVLLYYENSYRNSDDINTHIYFKGLCSSNNCRSFKNMTLE